MKKICIVTVCENKKYQTPMPAWKIYKSSRIKAVYNRRGNHDMYILSAEHGLLPPEKVIQPYNRIMNEQRSKELISDMIPIIQKYDIVIFLRAGVRELYEECIRSACKKADRKMVSFGDADMSDIGEMEIIIQTAPEMIQRLDNLSSRLGI